MGFCKFHCFLGHNTSHCVLFRDLVQKALEEGRLKFGDKSRQSMHVDANPLKTIDTLYVDVSYINMVEVSEEIIGVNFIEPKRVVEGHKVDIVKDTEGHECNDARVTEEKYTEKIQVAYPKAEEELTDFLNICKIINFAVMLCPRCSAVFDKEAANTIEGFRPRSKRKGKWADSMPKFSFNQRDVPYKVTPSYRYPKKGQVKNFTLSSVGFGYPAVICRWHDD
jgi:hypothetical protein